MTAPASPIGLVLGNELPPEQIPRLARLGEDLGFGELWLPEDYFYNGAVAGAAMALGATERIPVGVGVVSVMARHPAVLAIECAALARTYPGRLRIGVGLGQPAWIDQMDLVPESPLAAVEECVTTLRRLLAGETVTSAGATFAFRDVKLTHPVAERVPIYAGVIGPKMLALAGTVADGVIASIFASVEYLAWARERVAERRGGDTGSGQQPLVCFAMLSVDEDGERARAAVRPAMAFYLSVLAGSPLIDAYGIGAELAPLAAGGPEAIAAGMPDEWLHELAVVGTPAQCAAQIDRLLDAGSDSVALFPMPAERTEELIRLTAGEVLPRLPQGRPTQ